MTRKRKLLGGPHAGVEVKLEDSVHFLDAEGGHYSRRSAASVGFTQDFHWVKGASVPWAVMGRGDYYRLVIPR